MSRPHLIAHLVSGAAWIALLISVSNEADVVVWLAVLYVALASPLIAARPRSVLVRVLAWLLAVAIWIGLGAFGGPPGTDMVMWGSAITATVLYLVWTVPAELVRWLAAAWAESGPDDWEPSGSDPRASGPVRA